MRFYALLVIAEAAIIAGSGIDARWRPASERRPWLARWFWWHLGPLWLVGLVGTVGLMRAAEACAQRSCERYEAARERAPLLIATDEPAHDGTTVSAGH